MTSGKICIVSGHYPKGVFFTELTKKLLIEYCKNHNYELYYDAETEVPLEVSELHFRRCLILCKAQEKFPNVDWYIWLDTDIYPKMLSQPIESCIDLSDFRILYHLFHEKPWDYPVNTGVKIVNRKAIPLEKEVYSKRFNCPFPFEQKIMADYILPKYREQIKIHDPNQLNCIYGLHNMDEALFLHVCNKTELERNLIILNKNITYFKNDADVIKNKYYRYYYYYRLLALWHKAKLKYKTFKKLLLNGEFKVILKNMRLSRVNNQFM